MKAFEYLRPESLDELLALMSRHGANAHLLAGGTDLVVGLRKGRQRPEIVIDLKHVAALRSDVIGTSTGLRIGARMVMTDVVVHDQIRRHFPALVEAALVVGSIQIRNRATVAGNICNASPAADTAPALLAYGARVNAIGKAGPRTLPLEEFFAGPGRTVLTPGEIVVSIDLAFPPALSGAAFVRLTRRHGVDLAIVSLCCLALASGEVRFAVGAMGPRPFLVRGDSPDIALERLMAATAPISDLRASDEYRSAMLPILARRALSIALERGRRQAGGTG